MSKYIINVGSAIVAALEGISATQPAIVAGFWANREFWFQELQHLRHIHNEYEQRLETMTAAHDRYANAHEGVHNRDEFGIPMQSPQKTTTGGERQRIVGNVHSALVKLADRALDLKITHGREYDSFVEKLRNLQ